MKNSDENHSTFRTRDIDVASYILSHGIQMAGVVPEHRSLFFIFHEPQECAYLSKEFMAGDDTCSARAVLTAGKHLRRLVRENL